MSPTRPTSIQRAFAIVALVLVQAACTAGPGVAGPLVTREPDRVPTEPAASDVPSPNVPNHTGAPPPTAEPASPGPGASASASPSPTGPTPLPSTQPTASTSPRPSPEATPAETTVLRIYLLADEKLVPVLRTVPRTRAVGRAALEQLISGPTTRERTASPPLTSSVPPSTTVLGLSIENGLATVDFSREFESGGGSASMFARLAQVVFTLTQFPTVERVSFRLDGRPVTTFSGEGIVLDGPTERLDYEAFLPLIFVDAPAYGAPLDNPARIVGLANTFEATFFIELRDAGGRLLVQQWAMATCGTGCWGTFDVTVPYAVGSVQMGSLVVYDESAKDGQPENVRTYPVLLRP